MIAYGRPSSEYVAAIESTPVCGVAIRKDVAAAGEAPWRRSDTAVGSTPHEHNGSGIPKRAALRTGFHPLPARWWLIVSGRTYTCSIPAIMNPSNMYGDISLRIVANE